LKIAHFDFFHFKISHILIRLVCWSSNRLWDCCTDIFYWRRVYTDTCDNSQLCHFLLLLLVLVSCHASMYVSMLHRLWDWEGSMVWWKRVWLRLWRIQLPFNLKWIKVLVLLSWFENEMKISHFGFENKRRVFFFFFEGENRKKSWFHTFFSFFC